MKKRVLASLLTAAMVATMFAGCGSKTEESQKSTKKPWVGSENQRVINVKESLVKKEIVLL